MMFLLVLLSFMILTNSQNNYQQRRIYYSEADNVCSFQQFSDQINIIINVDDQFKLKRTIWGWTSCGQWSLTKAQAISPSSSMSLTQYEDNHRTYYHDIDFHQETIRKNAFGFLTDLTQNVTVKNPAIIYGKEHNCTIFGDGSVQHFGIDFSTPPAEIYMRCLSNNGPGEGNKNIQKNHLVSQ